MQMSDSMKNPQKKNFDFPEKEALVKSVAEYLETGEKADAVFERNFSKIARSEARNEANAVYKTFLRNKIAIESCLKNLCPKSPKKKLRVAIFAAAADCIARKKTFQAVDSWVEFIKKNLSAREGGFANAVLRKIPAEYAKLLESAEKSPTCENLSAAYSHPLWLVERWSAEFGIEKTTEILKANSQASKVFVRSSMSPKADGLVKEFSESLFPTPFEDFFILKSGGWSAAEKLLDSGCFYIQDPSTSFAPRLLNPKAGEKILDLCAAPGGKSRYCADIVLRGTIFDEKKCADTLILSSDLAGARMDTLRENLKHVGFLRTEAVEADLSADGSLRAELEKKSLPLEYDAVLLDAPCSNTGVLRRRPDARYRLSEDAIAENVRLQRTLIKNAMKFVKKGGRFVYSTCSIERAENIENAEFALGENPDFRLVESKVSFPDEFQDGGGAFLFERI